MKTINLLKILGILIIGISCSKDEPEEITLRDKLIGNWIEVLPCDSCNTFTFTEDDTIFQKNNLDNNILTSSYQFITNDSIIVTRNWEIEESKKTSKHKLNFYTNDTLEIKQFLPVDYGITGFEDIKLNKTK